MPEPVDFDLHGFVGIRLLDATPRDVAVVTRQVGPIQKPLERTPDVVIRFVDRLPTTTPMYYVGVDDVGFTEDAFLVLRGKHKTQVRVQIPFDKLGQQCEIICERGVPAVPLLIATINLSALQNGVLPMHASAFTYKGVGVMVTGWAKGGKTEALLSFMARGAEYVGDEWVYLSANGEKMYGIPEPIRLWRWQLQSMRQYLPTVKRKNRLKLQGLNLAARSMDAASLNGRLRYLKSASGLVKRQLNVQVPPHRLFGKDSVSLAGQLDKVFYVASYSSPEVVVEPMDSQLLAGRMAFSLQEEQEGLIAYYRRFRFSFPDAPNTLIDKIEDIQLDLLRRALDGKTTYAVYHPYPVAIATMYDAMESYL